MIVVPANGLTVGVVGFGRIGGAVATHLLATGYRTLGWARWPEALASFVAQGEVVVGTLADFAGADRVIFLVLEDAATRRWC